MVPPGGNVSDLVVNLRREKRGPLLFDGAMTAKNRDRPVAQLTGFETSCLVARQNLRQHRQLGLLIGHYHVGDQQLVDAARPDRLEAIANLLRAA
jgi:hypothetical protein